MVLRPFSDFHRLSRSPPILTVNSQSRFPCLLCFQRFADFHSAMTLKMALAATVSGVSLAENVREKLCRCAPVNTTASMRTNPVGGTVAPV